MAKTKTAPETKPEPSAGVSELAQALITAIEITKPKGKVKPHERKKNTPWTPKNGAPRLKLKRRMYHHGLEIRDRVSNEEIALLNQIRPGLYLNNWVKVVRRRDKGIDIDYPVKTAGQRLKLVNEFGVRNFTELLQRIVEEGLNPKQFKPEDELD
jgi:hypothetical protein